MQDNRSDGMGSQYSSYQHMFPFYPRVPGPVNFPWENYPGYATSFLNKISIDISSLTKMIASNNQTLDSTLKKIDKISDCLEEADNDIKEKISQLKSIENEETGKITFSELNQVPYFTNQPLITKIFNRESFKYKIRLEHRIPKIIYKDRKLSFKVRLINPDQTAICNVNFIHLCVGACDEDGEWILNEDGDLFIGGKIEVDLYHGQAQFKRIYPNDISRRYSSNNIKLIIYPKQSVLRFIGQKQRHEKEVDPQEIQPLVISDVLVKAKKKI